MEQMIFSVGMFVTVLMVIVAIVMRFNEYKDEKREFNNAEVTLNFVKCFVYSTGAIMVYRFFNVNIIETNSDVLTCYAFLLCIIEAAHTFINSVLELILWSYFQKKINYK